MNKVPHKVFICYSTQDKAIAEAVCNALESRDISCWIAPRDVLPGTEWAEAVVDAIDKSRALVLVLSANSNKSPQVRREIGRAASNGIPIFPFRIEDVSLSKAMRYYISGHQFLDALTPPLEKHLARMTDTMQQILSQEEEPEEERPTIPKPKDEAKRVAEEAKKAQEVEEKTKMEAEEKARKEAEKATKEREKREAKD